MKENLKLKKIKVSWLPHLLSDKQKSVGVENKKKSLKLYLKYVRKTFGKLVTGDKTTSCFPILNSTFNLTNAIGSAIYQYVMGVILRSIKWIYHMKRCAQDKGEYFEGNEQIGRSNNNKCG